MGEAANFRGHLDIGVSDLVTDVMGAIGKRYFIVGIMKFRVMVENLRLDRNLYDEGYRVSKGFEFERGLDVRSLDGPVRQGLQSGFDFRFRQYLMLCHRVSP
jgi:hypothetical protein